MTQPGIEPSSPGPLANTLPTRPMSRLNMKEGERDRDRDRERQRDRESDNRYIFAHIYIFSKYGPLVQDR